MGTFRLYEGAEGGSRLEPSDLGQTPTRTTRSATVEIVPLDPDSVFAEFQALAGSVA
jgi:hypothetical protein